MLLLPATAAAVARYSGIPITNIAAATAVAAAAAASSRVIKVFWLRLSLQRGVAGRQPPVPRVPVKNSKMKCKMQSTLQQTTRCVPHKI